MEKIRIAESFLNLAGNGKVKDAFDKYISAVFLHHNQYFQGSSEALQKTI